MKALLLITAASLGAASQTAALPQRASVSNSAPALLTAAQCKCSLDVTVKRSGTGEPLSNVEVSATPVGTGNSAQAALMLESLRSGRGAARALPPGTTNALTATTDSSGHAVFHDLAESAYIVRAQHEGYFGPARNGTTLTYVTASAPVGPVNSAPPARGNASGAGGQTSVAPQPVQQVTLNMIPGGTIAGRLLDSNRRPVSGVPVGAFRVSYQDGRRTLASAATSVVTDDRGEYRLFGLPPGEYYIHTGTIVGQLARTQTYPIPTYYPGTWDAAMAVALVLREGQEMTGTDFNMQLVTGVTISGNVINNLPGGLITAGGGGGFRGGGQISRTISSMYLVPRNPTFFGIPQLLPNISTAARGDAANDGTNFPFESRGVPPGSYDFYPVFTDGPGFGTGARAAGVRPTSYTGRTRIEVGSENIRNVTSVIRPGEDLKGHLSIRETPPTGSQPLNLTSVRIGVKNLDNVPSTIGAAGTVTPDADGRFSMSNMIDARYMISEVSGLPSDAYVSEMRLGAQSFYDNGVFEIGKATPDPIEIVITYGGQTIQGIVEDAQHKPVGAARVVLIPDAPRRQNLLLYKSATSIPLASAAGGFAVFGVAPGSYTLFAWENIPEGAEQNPEFIREYETKGVRLIVSPGVVPANVTVPLIPGKR